ncbi:hypothetical protein F5Y15DRAFT_232402 [Xylariaceae sp. FL0016]|nr:hypothetical protein F5Y15DRAFT_232402 [Xylariaceae sp. FL0016]
MQRRLRLMRRVTATGHHVVKRRFCRRARLHCLEMARVARSAAVIAEYRQIRDDESHNVVKVKERRTPAESAGGTVVWCGMVCDMVRHPTVCGIIWTGSVVWACVTKDVVGSIMLAAVRREGSSRSVVRVRQSGRGEWEMKTGISRTSEQGMSLDIWVSSSSIWGFGFGDTKPLVFFFFWFFFSLFLLFQYLWVLRSWSSSGSSSSSTQLQDTTSRGTQSEAIAVVVL